MQRPILSDTSLLAHIFGPKKNPQPTGIRKTKLKGKKGQTKGRIAAFNRMSPVNQELLKRTGRRDEYLRGEISLTDVRKAVRAHAVSLGVAKPTPNMPQLPTRRVQTPMTRRQMVDKLVARHIKITLSDAGRRYSDRGIDERVPRIPSYIVEHVQTWDYAQIKAAAGTGSPFEIIEANNRFNPFWYQ